jgi:hypothetical protein
MKQQDNQKANQTASLADLPVTDEQAQQTVGAGRPMESLSLNFTKIEY